MNILGSVGTESINVHTFYQHNRKNDINIITDPLGDHRTHKILAASCAQENTVILLCCMDRVSKHMIGSGIERAHNWVRA